MVTTPHECSSYLIRRVKNCFCRPSHWWWPILNASMSLLYIQSFDQNRLKWIERKKESVGIRHQLSAIFFNQLESNRTRNRQMHWDSYWICNWIASMFNKRVMFQGIFCSHLQNEFQEKWFRLQIQLWLWSFDGNVTQIQSITLFAFFSSFILWLCCAHINILCSPALFSLLCMFAIQIKHKYWVSSELWTDNLSIVPCDCKQSKKPENKQTFGSLCLSIMYSICLSRRRGLANANHLSSKIKNLNGNSKQMKTISNGQWQS